VIGGAMSARASNAAAAAALNLSRTFESRLLASDARAGPARVPAVIISGFLGSGKTTCLRSLLQSRGNLRFAVIMNELADADIDSGLLGGAAPNAACGLPLLSVPNACACCSGAAELRAALRHVLDAAADVDALLLETTGLADPAPLAGALSASGATLECVVTVVDAEAALSQLASAAAPTLHAQLRCADLVVLNKVRALECARCASGALPSQALRRSPTARELPASQCDLVGLGTLADTEDALAKLTPARVIRCRQGNIPLAAVLDVHSALPAAAPLADAGGGVISHEAGHAQHTRLVLERQPDGCRGIKRRLEEAAAVGGGPLRTPHALELERISTVVWRAAAGPVCAAAFSAWLLHAAAHAPGLLRAKGQLWVSQCRQQRFSFHFSGARRVEAVAEESWEGAGSTTVVLIGTDRGELLALRDALESSVARPPPHSDDTIACDVAAAFAALLASDARFELPPPAAADGTKDAPGFVAFSLRGRPHQGVQAAVLNCALARRMNAAVGQRLLVWGAPAYASVRIVFGGAEDVAAAHAGLLSQAEAVLRDALQHIGLCNCG
jgi:G3E family GTPase